MEKDWTGGFSSVFTTMGAVGHSSHEREKHDYYATEPKATEWLCRIEKFEGKILEPSCGEGHISRVLSAYGYEVESRDLIDRGFGTPNMDFLSARNTFFDGNIVTNPPYRYALEFVEKALDIIPPGKKVAMFLKLTFLESRRRKVFFEKYPLLRVWISSSRLKCAMNGDFEKTANNAVSYGWFIWKKGYQGKTTLKWFN